MNSHSVDKLLKELVKKRRLVKMYLETGGGLNISDSRGRALLHYAVRRDIETVRLLLSAGADPNVKDRKGRTPLHYAVKADDEIVVELIKAGADVNARDNDGRTPLHWAAAVKKNEETASQIEN